MHPICPAGIGAASCHLLTALHSPQQSRRNWLVIKEDAGGLLSRVIHLAQVAKFLIVGGRIVATERLRKVGCWSQRPSCDSTPPSLDDGKQEPYSTLTQCLIRQN